MTTLAVMGHNPNQRFSFTTTSGCLKAANMYRQDIFTPVATFLFSFRCLQQKTFLPCIIAVNYENKK